MRTHKRALGIRTVSARVQTLGPADRTLNGTYWYDLRARRPVAAIVKRVIDLIVAIPFALFCAPLLLMTRRPPQERVGFRGQTFHMYRGTLLRFLNVMDGTMSLVGPRPLRPDEVTRSDARRFSVPPGITGLWRVEEGTEQELDRRYVNEWSVGLDLVILLKTGVRRRPAAPRP